MSHDLANIGGRTAMMYFGEPPWHRLGQKLDRPATASEAIKAAGLDWEVEKAQIYFDQAGRLREVPLKMAVVRKDLVHPNEPAVPLGVVGSAYTPLQNREAFDWFDPIVGAGAAIYHTAGALGDGARVWILAKLPEDIRVIGDDIAEKFLLLSNSHDGGSSVQVKFTPIRVVCQNTLTMALNQGRCVRIAHTRSLPERMEAARAALGTIRLRFDQIAFNFQRLARVGMSVDRLKKYTEMVFPMPSDPDDLKGRRRVEAARDGSNRLFEAGKGNAAPGVRGTLWAAYNGVAEYVDHVIQYRDDHRCLDSIWFGGGYLTKARAFQLAVKSAESWKN